MWLWDKYVAPPGPVALGRSDTDSLQSERISDVEEGVYTWEQWEAEVQAEYPIRYFLDQVLVRELALVWRRFHDLGYWARCHLWTRYHRLNLASAEPELPEGYRWGYIDPCQVMLLASFLALRMYIEKEQPVDPAVAFPSEEQTTELYLREKQLYDDAMALYRWWTKERVEEHVESHRLFTLAEALPRRSPERKAATATWLAHYRAMEEKPQAMFLRLAKIREGLWT